MKAPAFKTILSKYRSSRGGSEIRLIVLHSAECAEVSSAAENLASWGGQNSSWHFAVDNDSITQSVPLEERAWHARQVNPYSIGVEQAGRASQTAEQWADPYSLAVIENTAQLVAWLCHTLAIPVEFIEADRIREMHEDGGAWGITTHAEVSKAFEERGGHWDPGPNYPIGEVIDRIDAILAEQGLKK
jgi:N-acetyl-anhydromuramyl-L-alanine amidase AmpD